MTPQFWTRPFDANTLSRRARLREHSAKFKTAVDQFAHCRSISNMTNDGFWDSHMMNANEKERFRQEMFSLVSLWASSFDVRLTWRSLARMHSFVVFFSGIGGHFWPTGSRVQTRQNSIWTVSSENPTMEWTFCAKIWWHSQNIFRSFVLWKEGDISWKWTRPRFHWRACIGSLDRGKSCDLLRNTSKHCSIQAENKDFAGQAGCFKELSDEERQHKQWEQFAAGPVVSSSEVFLSVLWIGPQKSGHSHCAHSTKPRKSRSFLLLFLWPRNFQSRLSPETYLWQNVCVWNLWEAACVKGIPFQSQCSSLGARFQVSPVRQISEAKAGIEATPGPSSQSSQNKIIHWFALYPCSHLAFAVERLVPAWNFVERVSQTDQFMAAIFTVDCCSEEKLFARVYSLAKIFVAKFRTLNVTREDKRIDIHIASRSYGAKVWVKMAGGGHSRRFRIKNYAEYANMKMFLLHIYDEWKNQWTFSDWKSMKKQVLIRILSFFVSSCPFIPVFVWHVWY